MQKRCRIASVCLILFSLTVICGFAQASDQVQEDIAKVARCPLCGMDRVKFAHSRIYISYADNTVFGGCSIHCAAVEFALNIDKTPISIQVGDYETKDLIDAEKATWVIGGNLPGVMTRRAKWAFGTEAGAQRFIRRHGGAKADFEQVMKATYEDMYTDTKMIHDKRKKMRRMQQNASETNKVDG